MALVLNESTPRFLLLYVGVTYVVCYVAATFFTLPEWMTPTSIVVACIGASYVGLVFFATSVMQRGSEPTGESARNEHLITKHGINAMLLGGAAMMILGAGVLLAVVGGMSFLESLSYMAYVQFIFFVALTGGGCWYESSRVREYIRRRPHLKAHEDAKSLRDM